MIFRVGAVMAISNGKHIMTSVACKMFQLLIFHVYLKFRALQNAFTEAHLSQCHRRKYEAPLKRKKEL